jgi:hypothetical protein
MLLDFDKLAFYIIGLDRALLANPEVGRTFVPFNETAARKAGIISI